MSTHQKYTEVVNNYKIMINDFNRNTFYKKILSQEVAGKNCLEVGFGTGILSIIACDFGAKHITAYEHNDDAYQFGLELIDVLRLSDRISLINETFTSSKILNITNLDVMFSETVDNSLWGEGWFSNTFIDNTHIKILPEKYFFESYCIEVNDNCALGFLTEPSHLFNPGIEINSEYIDFINGYFVNNRQHNVMSNVERYKTNKIVDISFCNQGTFWGWHSQLMDMFDVRQRVPDFRYMIDVNKKIISIDEKNKKPTTLDLTSNWSKIEFHKEITTPNSNYLLFFRVGFESNNEKYYLDTSHFGPFTTGFLVASSDKKEIINFSHNLFDGSITATYGNTIIKKHAFDNWSS
jgi:hypothetical protein